MSKRYNVKFEIEEVNEDNEYITTDMGCFSVVNIPRENIEKLIAIYFGDNPELSDRSGGIEQ